MYSAFLFSFVLELGEKLGLHVSKLSELKMVDSRELLIELDSFLALASELLRINRKLLELSREPNSFDLTESKQFEEPVNIGFCEYETQSSSLSAVGIETIVPVCVVVSS